MNERQDRGPRFGLPVGLAEAGLSGFRIGPTGRFDLAEGDDCIRQDLLLLLFTTPGERVMRADYGCHLKRLLFQPNDQTLAGLAIHYVTQAIRRFEPRVEVISLDASPLSPSGSDAVMSSILEIMLHYRVRRSQREHTLAVAVDLNGGDR